MKFLSALIGIILLAGCTTCPQEKEITEAIAGAFVGHAQCGNFEAIKEDISPIVEAKEYCEKVFDTSEFMSKMPQLVKPQEARSMPVWSAKGMQCWLLVPEIKRKFLKDGYPKKWACKKKLNSDFQTVDNYLGWECQRL
jgi:hypothetical protein